MKREEGHKWMAVGCFMLGALMLMSPRIAATSVVPWLLHFTGNLIWFIDSKRRKDFPWMAMSVFFIATNIVAIYARIFNTEPSKYIEPIITILEKLI